MKKFHVRGGSTRFSRRAGRLQCYDSKNKKIKKSATGTKSSTELRKGTLAGTWKIRTIHQCGKVKKLTHELEGYQWNIVGLTEVRWSGFGETAADTLIRLVWRMWMVLFIVAVPLCAV